MDFELLVRAIEGGGCSNVSCLALIREIRKLIVTHEIVKVTYTYRETNLSVDVLVNIMCFDKSFHVFSEAPTILTDPLNSDKTSVVTSLEMHG